MPRSYSYEEIIQKKMDVLFIDVRSESEFAKEHIPNAINIPLLNDEQRKIVGTIYKQEGQRQAMEQGLAFVGPRLIDIYHEFYKHVKENRNFIVYCARGGHRSRSITTLLQQFSFSIAKLDGGYKSYREYINSHFKSLLDNFTFITLYGPTGSGKTKLLEQLASNGYDILDLEACANNRGSILGGIGLGDNHSQKQFESLVFDSLTNAKSNVIFTEGESKRIGSIVMPEFLYQKISGDYKIYIDCPLHKRIQIIKEEYISDDLDWDKLNKAFNRLRRYHSNNKIDLYLEQLDNNQSELVIESLIVDYYDKVYSSMMDNFKYRYTNNDEKQCVNNIINDFKKRNIIK